MVNMPEPKRKKLGEWGVKGICIRYVQHSKAYRFVVIKPNDFVLVNSIIESRDVIFYENSVLEKSPVETQTENLDMENEND